MTERPQLPQEAYTDIGDHGLIGDRRTAALVASDGTIDWWCLPAFDGEVVLGSILDARRGGFWRLGPRAGQRGVQDYVGRTGVSRTHWSGDGWELELLDAMLLPSNDRHRTHPAPAPTILRRLRCLAGRVECLHHLEPRLCFGTAVPAVQRELQRDCFVWRFHPRSLGHPDPALDGLEGAFVPCTFWLASALARMQRSDEARHLVERIDRAFHGRGLYSEEFDPGAGRALGNFPLLFSHAEHLKAVMDLAKSSPLGMAGMAAGMAAGKLVRAVRSP